eukprot:gene31318-15243_t
MPPQAVGVVAVVGGAVAFCALLFLVFRRRVFAATALFEEGQRRDA